MTPRFVRADGSPFGWRGASKFLLHARFMRGESIDQQIDWMHSLGVNIARVFMRVPWGVTPFGDWRFYAQPERDAHYEPSVRAFFQRFTDEGIRVQPVSLTDSSQMSEGRTLTQQLFDIARDYPLVTPQTANEPNVNGIDTRSIMAGVDRHGVLSCAGDYLTIGTAPDGSDEVGDGFMPSPPLKKTPFMLDYGDLHTERSWHQPPISSDRYPRNGKEPKEFTDTFGIPWVDGEPVGFGEVPHAGSGARLTDIQQAMGHHAIAHLLTPGSTLHTQAGLEGRAPDPVSEPIQTAMCEDISRMWRFIPEDCYLGEYSRPNLSPATWPMTWTAGDVDSLVGHAYASIHGNTAWACVPLPRAGWEAVGVNGWRVDAQLDGFPFVVRLTR